MNTQEIWVAALDKVAQDFHDKYQGIGDIGLEEVRAFLNTRHIHYPECQPEPSGRNGTNNAHL